MSIFILIQFTHLFQYIQVAEIEEENMRLRAEVEWHRNYLDASQYEQQLMLHNRINELTTEVERLNRQKVNADFFIVNLS